MIFLINLVLCGVLWACAEDALLAAAEEDEGGGRGGEEERSLPP